MCLIKYIFGGRMALINCPECGKEVSDAAKVCIHCGFPLEKNALDAKVATINPQTNQNSEPNHAGHKIFCPRCGSDNVHFITVQTSQNFDKGDACCGYLLCGPLGLLCGVKGKTESKTVRKCMNCTHEF